MRHPKKQDRPFHHLLEMIRFTEGLSAKLHGLPSQEAIFNAVIEECVRSKRFTANILMLTDDQSHLTITATTLAPGIIGGLEKEAGATVDVFTIDLDKSPVLAQVAREGKTAQADAADIVRDLFPDQAASSMLDVFGEIAPQRSVFTPLKRGRKVTGVFSLTAPEMADEFVPSVRNLAQHISAALELVSEQTERIRAVEALQHGEEHFRVLIENASEVIAVLDANTTIKYASPSLERLFGFAPQKVVGKSMSDFVHPDDLKQVRERFAEVIATAGKLTTVEFRHQHKNGEWRTVQLMATNLLDNAAVQGIVINYRDSTLQNLSEQEQQRLVNELEERNRVVTAANKELEQAMDDRARAHNEVQIHWHELEATNDELRDTQARLLDANEKLRGSEEQYRSLVENAGTPITFYDPDGQFLLVNTLAADIMGSSPDFLIGKTLYDIAPETADPVMDRMRQVMETGNGIDFEELVELSAGSFWLRSSMQPVRDRDGEIVAVQVISQDITERKQAEKALGEREQEYSSLVELSPDGIAVLKGADIIFMNERAAQMCGYSVSECVGKSFVDLIMSNPPDVLAGTEFETLISELKKAADNQDTTLTFSMPIRTASQETRWVEITTNPIEYRGERARLSFIRDVTERKQTAESIERLNAVLTALRKVDRLLLWETDRQRLIEGACDTLTKARGYSSAWIALMDQSGAMVTSVEAGVGDAFPALIEQMKRGSWPACVDGALGTKKATTIDYALGDCGACALLSSCGDRAVVTIRLQYGSDVYGVACLSSPTREATDHEERSLIEEVAGDIAFGLHNIELEEKRKTAEDEIRAQHDEIQIHTHELEAANDELRQAQMQLIEANRMLRQSEEKYRAIFEHANDEIIYLDKFGAVIDRNRRDEDMLGYTMEEVIGKNIKDLTPIVGEQLPRMLQTIRQEASEAGGGISEFKMWHKNGTAVFVEASMSTLLKEDRLEGILIILRDITERKHMEERVNQYSEELEQRYEELQAAYEKLQVLDKMKDSFLSTVSHELRTPLTSIKSFAEILLTYENDRDTQLEFLGIINEESDRLTRLINDVLDISKIEAGRVQWETSELEIAEIIEMAVNATHGLTSQAELSVTINSEPDLPVVWGDRDRIVQVMANLLSNAAKFTRPGGQISIAAEAVRSTGPAGPLDMVQIGVADTGVGIAPEDQSTIFEKFHQVGDTLKDKPKGTGLGLAICKEIIEHYGGWIWVESQVGEGSTFYFTLPVVEAQPAEIASVEEIEETIEAVVPAGIIPEPTTFTETETLPDVGAVVAATGKLGGVILVVDDEPHIRRLLSHELSQRGYEVIEASNGNEAITLARKHFPDLITLDVLMPDINGLDVTAVLRSDPETKNIPIIIISVMEYQDRALEIGVDGYITKPFDADEVTERIGQLLRKPPASILVVDDDKALVRSIKYELEMRGYSVHAAYNGEEGLRALKKARPDLIVLDLKMPGMDGHHFMQALKDASDEAEIPIIVLTGIEIDGGREQVVAMGATDYVLKSGGLQQLFESIDAILEDEVAG